MNFPKQTLPRKYHEAVVRWQNKFLKDYDLLLNNWEKYFPRDSKFCLCAYRDTDVPNVIQVGDNKGKPKYQKAGEMNEDLASALLHIVRAQASTEFGSIQQHQETLARAQSDEDRFWVLRVMAEELRHGYQMFHLLLSDDWSGVSKKKADEYVEEILSMETGSHVLGAFNVNYDSFVDNVVFAALIDRVGKYQLTMQKVCSYGPFSQSMPPMLQEEAFHLAAGVVPLRRWVTKAAQGEVFITMPVIQKVFYKWFPLGLDMFGHEKGGGSNVRMGFKDMTNAEAQSRYIDECQKLVADLNLRYVRAKLPKLSAEEAERLLEKVLKYREPAQGLAYEELIHRPDKRFNRRRGVFAYQMFGVRGEEFTDLAEYGRHLAKHLPEAYLAGKEFKFYFDLLKQVVSEEITVDQAIKSTPVLKHVGGSCPCSKSVRWIVEEEGEEVNPATVN
ncbi:MAG: Phenylacetic acid catabolic protein [Nitrospinota bacterium]